jgi:hypothetical protein
VPPASPSARHQHCHCNTLQNNLPAASGLELAAPHKCTFAVLCAAPHMLPITHLIPVCARTAALLVSQGTG